jgi:hypothetical protein
MRRLRGKEYETLTAETDLKIGRRDKSRRLNNYEMT